MTRPAEAPPSSDPADPSGRLMRALLSSAGLAIREDVVSAPAQSGAGAVPAFQTTDTFPGLSTTPEYYIPSGAPAGTNYPYTLDTGESGTITVVGVQVIPDI